MTMHHRRAIVVFGHLFLLLLFSACTLKGTTQEITDTTSNITASTSGRIWWNEDGLLKPEHKVAAFTAYNAHNLEQDVARGQGEYLTSLSTLMGRAEDQTFPRLAQASYSRWSRSENASTDDLVRQWQSTGRRAAE
ncbi:MAG: hypothetical protein OJF47_001865 [Nitrospira sp.]|jgi:hypothetical protein|nr:MAG: hypothetical protein OJF47_001865 [Nitrospira sp.]